MAATAHRSCIDPSMLAVRIVGGLSAPTVLSALMAILPHLRATLLMFVLHESAARDGATPRIQW